MSIATFLTQGSIQAAFIAISSRIVGSAFRCLETLNPKFQKTQVISNPKTVFTREVVTISMAWGFALLTNIAIKPLAQKRRWSSFWVQFATTVIGTSIAESIGRLIAYRKALQEHRNLDTHKSKRVYPRPILSKQGATVLPLLPPRSLALTPLALRV